MNINMIQPKTETEDLLLSITKKLSNTCPTISQKTGRNTRVEDAQTERNISFQSTNSG